MDLRSVTKLCPTEHDWEEEQPTTEEDAVKRMVKRQLVLNGKGLVGDLWRMHQACHKAVEEEGDASHLPMNFVRYEGNEPEVKGELFYICRSCLSQYLKEHPEAYDRMVVLRGKVSKEAEEAIFKHQEAQAKEQHEKEQAKYQESLEKPCPICGKKLKDHDEEQWKSCSKQYATQNPFDEEGGTNKP